MDDKTAKVTDEHRSEAAALSNIWRAKKRITQEVFGEKYNLGSQGNVGHYLNGRRALNIKTAMAFAAELGCSIEEFSPRLAREEAGLLSKYRAMGDKAPPSCPESGAVNQEEQRLISAYRKSVRELQIAALRVLGAEPVEAPAKHHKNAA